MQGQVPRHRARHKNSHSGCLTCKQRHVKCDETKPTCVRCQLARRICTSHLPNALTVLNTVEDRSFRPCIDGQTYAASCVQYFKDVTLQAFHQSEPSPIWDYLRREVSGNSSILSLAEALGHEHRAAVDPSVRSMPEAAGFYVKAVHDLRRTINDAGHREKQSTLSTVVLHCLLLVILQCFQKAFDELNIHLRHGLHLASQAVNDPQLATSMPLNACLRLLKQYSVSVALFNPLLPQEVDECTAATANQALSEPGSIKTLPGLSTITEHEELFKDEVQNLILDLIGTTLTYRKPRMNQRFDGDLHFHEPPISDEALLVTVTRLRERHARLSSAIVQKLQTQSGSRRQHLQISEATIMLLGIYLRRRWSGYQSNWDLESHAFSEIISKISNALEDEMHLHAQRSAEEDHSSAFSVGLGIIAPLFYVSLMCREPQTRRAAVELLSRCPQQDGPWNARLASRVCITIINFEERKAAAEHEAAYFLTKYIPEHCRVSYYYYRNVIDGDLGQAEGEYLRVFRQLRGGSGGYTHEDLKLDFKLLEC